jgi:hypothetical protein
MSSAYPVDHSRPVNLSVPRVRLPVKFATEPLLAATVQNLRKLAKLIPFPEPAFAL